MEHLPVYLSAATYAEVVAIEAAAAYVLYQGARSAGLDNRRAAEISTGAVLLFGGWLALSSVIGGQGAYRTRLGHGVPWLPIATLGFFGVLMALSRLPSVASSLNAPGALQRLMLPHSFRVAGVVFVVAMLLGKLPPLFALPAGFGDIAIGIATPWITRRLTDRPGARPAFWFNVFGMADLISALALGALTGFRIVSVNPPATLNGELPLVLIPTVGVPLLFALHITSLTVLIRGRTAAGLHHQFNADPQIAQSTVGLPLEPGHTAGRAGDPVEV
ncbi:MAG TPA: hypothetical protein VHV75_06660 [Solirubrobacteraceae bacterium]|jgi:hypothetical protein|nr:hypothetical protein [Solirubrobacteraceae bacterium]